MKSEKNFFFVESIYFGGKCDAFLLEEYFIVVGKVNFENCV